MVNPNPAYLMVTLNKAHYTNSGVIENGTFSVECTLIQTVDLPMEQLFIGEIVAAYSEDRYLTDGTPDMTKMNPILLIQPRKMYAAVGPDVAPAWEIGKKLIK